MLAAVGAMLVTGCSKSPEGAVNDLYSAVQSKQFEKTLPYMLPDSVSALSDTEKEAYAEMLSGTFWPEAASYEVQSVEVNPEETEARFVVKTSYGVDNVYTETGILRKTAEGNWRLIYNNEATDTVDVIPAAELEEFSYRLVPNVRAAITKVLANRGMADYQYMYAFIVDGKLGNSKNPEGYFEWIEKAANQNHVNALNKLAWCYYDGIGVRRDYEKALETHKKAAELGNVKSMNSVGYMYQFGEGTVRDYEEAAKWYRKAAEHGNPIGYNNLGTLYKDGEGVAKDLAKAFELYSKSAEMGEDYGMMNLGECYRDGTGVDKDINKAIEWLTKAAGAGNVYAMTDLGDIYYNGNGIDKNFDKSYYWYKKAADKNNTYGRYMVAQSIEYGRGTQKDVTDAKHRYLKIWNDTKYKPAETAYDRLYNW